jgi:hypothetical protein
VSLCCALALVAATLPRRAECAPTQQLARARAEYGRSEYQKTIDLLAPLMANSTERQDLTENEQLEAYRLLGLSYFFLSQSASTDERATLLGQSGAAFSSLLFIDPDYELDAAIDGPDAADYFSQVKRDNLQKLEEIRKQKALDAERKKRPQVERVVTRIERDPAGWSNFVPFGYPQFRNGQDRKGAVFLVLETSTFVASAGLYLKHALKYGWPVGKLPSDPTEVDSVRTEQYLQIGAGLAFWSVYAWGVYDGYHNQRPSLETRETVRPIKYDDDPTPTPTTRPSAPSIDPERPAPRQGALIYPLIMGDVLGVGVTWEM